MGYQNFYRRLKEMPEEERKKINMREVKVVNQLYGDDKLRILQRKRPRFINVTHDVNSIRRCEFRSIGKWDCH